MNEIENIFLKRKESEKQENLSIVADHREKNSLLISELIKNNVRVELKHLEIADFLVNNVAVERKTVSDFLNSMINKRLFSQLENLKQYEKCFLIIEGIEEQELYNDYAGGINGNAIRGFLLSIILDFQIPVIFTKDYQDSAKFLTILIKKQNSKTEISLNPKRKSKSLNEQKQFVIEGFPGIGPKSAKKLLEKFSSIKNITNASEEELKEILGKKAESFRKILD
ncbi:hypothetical protein COV15_02765 [Candidatus Woesearchaeota archaeon CG10_big_fil_rev_8_21_14_0_10_34_12]|nr:MAG: hypothetical protein COV15_02765 [Candidatus Woesearchaeota archaeon CG10_big_fil_rev_8_21_14_0_10_34_12]